MSIIKTGAVQMACVFEDKNANMRFVESMIQKAAAQGVRLLAFPELFTTGYLPRNKQLAEPIPGPTTEYLERQAKKHSLYLSGAILERADDLKCCCITAFIVGPEGIVGKHRKIGLWDQEQNSVGRGGQFSVFQTPFATLGLQICYEMGFPEISRLLALQGAKILLCPSAFGLKRLYAWKISTQARSLENGVFLIAAARSGTDLDKTFAGCSRIVAPDGSILAEAREDNELIVADLDLAWIERQREAIPYLTDLKFLSLPNMKL